MLYRQLRKAQEDTKNEPGAADFYYGEMEMRRNVRSTLWPERWVLYGYWLVAGYALRANRALATLLIVLVLASGLLTLYGLPADDPRPAGLIRSRPGSRDLELIAQPPRSELPRTALRDRLTAARVEQAARTSFNAAVFRSTGQQLTIPGQYIEMAVRFFGPVLLGLALLSIRNRVKRQQSMTTAPHRSAGTVKPDQDVHPIGFVNIELLPLYRYYFSGSVEEGKRIRARARSVLVPPCQQPLQRQPLIQSTTIASKLEKQAPDYEWIKI